MELINLSARVIFILIDNKSAEYKYQDNFETISNYIMEKKKLEFLFAQLNLIKIFIIHIFTTTVAIVSAKHVLQKILKNLNIAHFVELDSSLLERRFLKIC